MNNNPNFYPSICELIGETAKIARRASEPCRSREILDRNTFDVKISFFRVIPLRTDLPRFCTYLPPTPWVKYSALANHRLRSDDGAGALAGGLRSQLLARCLPTGALVRELLRASHCPSQTEARFEDRVDSSPGSASWARWWSHWILHFDNLANREQNLKNLFEPASKQTWRTRLKN